MRKFVVFGLVSALFVTSVVLSPLSLAQKGREAARETEDSSKPFESLVTPAQKGGLVPQSAVAVGFAKSRTVREIAASQKTPRPFKYQRPLTKSEFKDEQKNAKGTPNYPLSDEQEEQREKNRTNKVRFRRTDESMPASPDEAIFKGTGDQGTKAPAPAIPGTTVNFEGQSIEDTIGVGQGFLPPDTVGDIGPNHYVQSVNSTFRIFSRAGAPLIPVTSLGALWATIPGPCAGSEDGDPIVLYDSLADRWLISQFCTVANPNNHQLIAISQTPDPTGAYYLYDFMMPNNKFNDYPKFGVWPNGYYMTDNQFNQAGTAFLGAGVFAFDRAKMLAGDPTATFIYFDLEPLDPTIGGVLPSDADGLNVPPAGAPNTFAYFIATEFGDASDGLRLFDFTVTSYSPVVATFLERTESPVAVAAFDPRWVGFPGGTRDDIEQPPPGAATSMLDSIGDRLMHRLQYRNFGTHESLITNHTVNVGTGTTAALHQTGVRYYEVRKTGAGPYAVNEQASYTGSPADTHNRWMGSAAMDHQGNLAVGYSVSSLTVFPSIRYAGRLAGDPAGGLAQGEATLVAGGWSQAHTASRWGDYSSMNIDPIDDCTFWYTQEYYSVDNPGITAEWKTRVGAFKVNPACTAPQQGTLTVNVTNCETLLPVKGATVSINGNLYGATAPNGSYSVQLPPGTDAYDVTIGGANYFPTTINDVDITNGNTTTLNQCIQGSLKDPEGAGFAYTAESCAPADNALSPGETVTVNFGLKNNGTTATSAAFQATLQATGGVTSPSGPQNYGVIPPDGTTVVTRPFTFTVDPGLTCGDQVTATLQLQDGATNLGTVTFTMQLGTPGPAFNTIVSTGNIATAIPDNTTVEIPINVPNRGFVNDINVRVRLNHTFVGDLVISLVHPDGTTVPLVSNHGGGATAGDNFGTGTNNCSGTPTVFDDEAATSINIGAPPFAGSFQPGSPLSGLDGKTTQGTWKLRVSDTATLDTGTVGCVTLELNRLTPLCCGVATQAVIEEGGPASITAENAVPANNAPDPGETVTVDLPLINVGDGNTTNLVGTLQATGGATSPSGPQNYGVVVAGGPPVSRPFTFTVSGSCGGTLTLTLNLQDGPTNLGTAVFTMQIGATVNTPTVFSSVTPIVFPVDTAAAGDGIGPATPYPSTINVAGLTNPVTKVTVTLTNLEHTFPDDIDILLVGPGGQKLLLMSDAGGGTDVVNLTYTFDDAAAATLADGALNGSGTYRPSNFDTTTDALPAPAPAGPHPDPQLLSVFNGVNPNGTWSLYARDDAAVDDGTIAGGWTLTITTSTVVCSPPPSGGGTALPGDLIISEFRVRGPAGAADEFIEIYNDSGADHTVSALSGTGYGIAASDGTTRCTIPNGTVIPNRGHFLCVNNTAVSGYSLSSYPAGNGTTATGDATYALDIPDNAGIALFNNNTGGGSYVLANRLDAVGSTSEANTLYKEGTGYPALTPFSIDYSFYRDTCGKGGSITTMGLCSISTPKDTDNNAADFIFVDTNGTSAGAGQRLGAPGPENLSSPIQRNTSISAILLDPCVVASSPPNRIRDFTSDPANNSTFGTLDVRRTFTNNTGGNVTRLRFRVIDITTFPAPSGFADLRPRTSTAVVVTVDRAPCGSGTSDVTVQGTTLEQPPSQVNGGGFNSSMSAGTVTLATPLANGASIDLRFLLGIQQTGTFKFYINIEALP